MLAPSIENSAAATPVADRRRRARPLQCARRRGAIRSRQTRPHAGPPSPRRRRSRSRRGRRGLCCPRGSRRPAGRSQPDRPRDHVSRCAGGDRREELNRPSRSRRRTRAPRCPAGSPWTHRCPTLRRRARPPTRRGSSRRSRRRPVCAERSGARRWRIRSGRGSHHPPRARRRTGLEPSCSCARPATRPGTRHPRRRRPEPPDRPGRATRRRSRGRWRRRTTHPGSPQRGPGRLQCSSRPPARPRPRRRGTRPRSWLRRPESSARHQRRKRRGRSAGTRRRRMHRAALPRIAPFSSQTRRWRLPSNAIAGFAATAGSQAWRRRGALQSAVPHWQ